MLGVCGEISTIFYLSIKKLEIMSTNSSSPISGTGGKPDGSRQRIIAIAAVVIVALLGINAYLLVSNMNKGKANTTLGEQLTESEQLKADLEKQYYEALSELEGMRSSNEELNTLIDTQKEELRLQKDKIDGLLRTGGDLKKARAEIGTLTKQINQYVAEVNQLREENAQLTEDKQRLTEEKEILATDLEGERTVAAGLASEKAMLVSDKENLEKEKDFLAKKVNIASVIKATGIEVEGQKLRSSGKPVSKSNASNVEQLSICFNTTENIVAESGSETFFVRIVNPLGETLAIESMGSGVFTSNTNGDQIRYTQKKEVNYSQKADKVCTVWKPNQPFSKGTYEVEIYNKGHVAGKSTFRLR